MTGAGIDTVIVLDADGETLSALIYAYAVVRVSLVDAGACRRSLQRQ